MNTEIINFDYKGSQISFNKGKNVMINVNIMFKMNKSIVILLVMRHIHINIIQKEKDNNVYQIVRLQDYNIHKILIVLVVVLVNMLIL